MGSEEQVCVLAGVTLLVEKFSVVIEIQEGAAH
jgi:hypothetical protein